MTQQEIEVWTRQIVEATLVGQPAEDSRIELKSEWIEVEKAAHQLAGHANAVGNARILWIVGIDEKRRALTNPIITEKSNWLAGLNSFFDGYPPTLLTDVNVIIEDKSVVALYFDTEQGAPYVVRCGTGGSYPQHVVPWREGTAKRTARRHELLRILLSKRSLADLKAELEFNRMAPSSIASKTVFRERAFEKAMSDGSIDSLERELMEKIMAAYIRIGNSNRMVEAAIRMPPLQDHYPGFSEKQAQDAVRETIPFIDAALQALTSISV